MLINYASFSFRDTLFYHVIRVGKKVRKIDSKREKNVKTADTIRPLFFVGPHMTLGNYKKLSPTLFDNIVNPQLIEKKMLKD